MNLQVETQSYTRDPHQWSSNSLRYINKILYLVHVTIKTTKTHLFIYLPQRLEYLNAYILCSQ